LVGSPEGKKPLGRPTHRWEDIRMDLKRHSVGRFGLGLSASENGLVRPLVNVVMNIQAS